MGVVKLLHGSDHIIEAPEYAVGNPHNDYGQGFYCTETDEMAREWACKKNTDGFVSVYDFDDTGLMTLNLMDDSHTVLNWIALLLKYRTFKLETELSVDAREYIIRRFSADLSKVDVVIGYRADDSYFQYAQAFVENALSLRGLSLALRFGKLGKQTAIISEKGFKRLTFLEAYPADKNVYYPKYISRDIRARETYRKETGRGKTYRDDIFVLDILREEMKDDDPRIQRILSE